MRRLRPRRLITAAAHVGLVGVVSGAGWRTPPVGKIPTLVDMLDAPRFGAAEPGCWFPVMREDLPLFFGVGASSWLGRKVVPGELN